MAKSINLNPLDERIVVEPVAAEETTAGGIVLPDSAKEKPAEGLIVAVGPGKPDEDGEPIGERIEEFAGLAHLVQPARQVSVDPVGGADESEQNTGPADLAEQPAVLDLGATIHDHLEAGRLRPPRRLVVADRDPRLVARRTVLVVADALGQQQAAHQQPDFEQQPHGQCQQGLGDDVRRGQHHRE